MSSFPLLHQAHTLFAFPWLQNVTEKQTKYNSFNVHPGLKLHDAKIVSDPGGCEWKEWLCPAHNTQTFLRKESVKGLFIYFVFHQARSEI